MRLLITLTILLLSFTINAQDDCKKAEDAFKEMNDYNTANGINFDDIEPLIEQVISAVDEYRNYKDVLRSMLDNKTIDIKTFNSATYCFLYIKYTMICRGEYSE